MITLPESSGAVMPEAASFITVHEIFPAITAQPVSLRAFFPMFPT